MTAVMAIIVLHTANCSSLFLASDPGYFSYFPEIQACFNFLISLSPGEVLVYYLIDNPAHGIKFSPFPFESCRAHLSYCP